MSSVPRDETYHAYWEAIRRRVCTVCLDCADDGSCGLTADRRCGIEAHLPDLLETIRSIKSGRMDEYVSAVEERVCSRCEQDEHGHCPLRQKGECALSVYMPLVVEAIEEVDAQRA